MNIRKLVKNFILAATYGAASTNLIERAEELSCGKPVRIRFSNTYLETNDPFWEALKSLIHSAVKAKGRSPENAVEAVSGLHLSPESRIALAKHSLELDLYERVQLAEPKVKNTLYRILGERPILGPATWDELKDSTKRTINRAGSSLREFESIADLLRRYPRIQTRFAYGESKQPFVCLEGVACIVGTYASGRSSELGLARLILPDAEEEEYNELMANFDRDLRDGERTDRVANLPSNWEENTIGRVLKLIQPDSDYYRPIEIPTETPSASSQATLLPPRYTAC